MAPIFSFFRLWFAAAPAVRPLLGRWPWLAALAGLLHFLPAQGATLLVADQSYNNRSVMQAAGVLDDLPYAVEWKQFGFGSAVAEALNGGSVDLGFLGDAPPLFLGALGAPIKVIGVIQEAPDGVAILASRDSGIHSLADLPGKRVAIWKGSWSQQLLFTALDKAGIPRDRVQLRYLNALDASHALEGGSVDAIATWDPYTTQQERRGARVLATARGLIPAQDFAVATEDALRDKRRQLADFLQRLYRARQWSLQGDRHLDAYAGDWAQRTGSDPNIARAWFRRSRTELGPITPSAIRAAQQTVDFFSSLGLIKGYPAQRLFDDSFAASFHNVSAGTPKALPEPPFGP